MQDGCRLLKVLDLGGLSDHSGSCEESKGETFSGFLMSKRVLVQKRFLFFGSLDGASGTCADGQLMNSGIIFWRTLMSVCLKSTIVLCHFWVYIVKDECCFPRIHSVF